jgi:hypothetical protein
MGCAFRDPSIVVQLSSDQQMIALPCMHRMHHGCLLEAFSQRQFSCPHPDCPVAIFRGLMKKKRRSATRRRLGRSAAENISGGIIGSGGSMPVGLLIGPASIRPAPRPLAPPPATARATGGSSSSSFSSSSSSSSAPLPVGSSTGGIVRGRSLSAIEPAGETRRAAAPAPRQRRDRRITAQLRQQRRALSSAPSSVVATSSQDQTLLGSSFSSMAMSSSTSSSSLSQGTTTLTEINGSGGGNSANPRGRRHRERPLSENTQRRRRSRGSSSVQGAAAAAAGATLATMAICPEAMITSAAVDDGRVEAAARLFASSGVLEPASEPPPVQTPWGARSTASRSQRSGSSSTTGSRPRRRANGSAGGAVMPARQQPELSVASQGIHSMNTMGPAKNAWVGGGSARETAGHNSKKNRPRLRKGRLHKGVRAPVPFGGRRASSSPPPPVPLAGENTNRNDLSVTVLGLGAC